MSSPRDDLFHDELVVLDELLWALFGWLWLAGGRSELETWTPDETRIAGVDDDELWQCEGCGGWCLPDQGCADEHSELCDDCWAACYWDPVDGREDYP